MANPVVPWELQQLNPEEDAPRINQNFGALVDWATFEAIHTRHIQVIQFNVSLQVAGNSTEYGAFNWPTPFPTGVTPVVLCSLNSLNATRPAAMAGGIISAFDMDDISTKAVVFNSTGTTFGSGIIGIIVGIDPTYNTQS